MRKINSTLREVVAEEVEKLSDSRLEMIAVTGVETAPNLRSAVVYIDALGDDPSAALDALRSAGPRIQRAIGRQVRLKYTPVLEFEFDPGVLAGGRIETILKQIHSDEEE